MSSLPDLSLLSSVPLSAPQHFGLDEDSSRKLEELLDDKSVNRLRRTRKASQSDTGRLYVETYKYRDGVLEDDRVGPNADWVITFDRLANGHFVAQPQFRLHDLDVRIANTFFVPWPKNGDIWEFYDDGEDIFRNVDLTLHVPMLGLNGLYSAGDNLDFVGVSAKTPLFVMPSTLDDPNAPGVLLYFQTAMRYRIRNPDVVVILTFQVNIPNDEYTDARIFEQTVDDYHDVYDGGFDEAYVDDPYEAYDEYFGKPYLDPRKYPNLAQETREEQASNMVVVLEDRGRRPESYQKDWVRGEWSLRAVRLVAQ